ncbi:MAG: CopD family protein, partial [Alphaproteobacteria bacterium]
TMEQRLLRIIMNPAMILVWVLGLTLIAIDPGLLKQGWLHLKLLLVLILTGLHMACSRWRRDLAVGKNRHSSRFYRMMNEIPTLAVLIIVVLVIVRPF